LSFSTIPSHKFNDIQSLNTSNFTVHSYYEIQVSFPHPKAGNPAEDLAVFINDWDKGKGKVAPLLLTEHDAIKAYWRVEV
jgi:hypothetical protein